jgi:thioredoxin 1
MPFDPEYHELALTRDELDQLPGPTLVEFGANWCGICAAFAPVLKELLDDCPQVAHVKVEDGRGKPLGRSFRVKLWPTLVFMLDGKMIRQVARPSREEAKAGLEAITKNST